MKKFLFFMAVAIFLTACNKEENSLNTVRIVQKSGEHGEPDHSIWEASLNENLTSKYTKPDRVALASFKVEIRNNNISQSEKSRIEGLILETTRNTGYAPYAIDINVKDGKVDVLYDDDGVFVMNPVPDPNADCTYYDENFAAATQCGQGGAISKDYFSDLEDAELRPSGGITFELNPDGSLGDISSLVPGVFCPYEDPEESPKAADEVGGPPARIAHAINQNIPTPNNFLGWKRIEPFIVEGSPTFYFLAGGGFVLQTPNIWNHPANQPEEGVHEFCLDSEEISDYYCILIDEITSRLPPNFYIVSCSSANYNIPIIAPGTNSVFNWSFTVYVGEPEICCDCCC